MNHEMIEKIVNAIKQNCVSDFEGYLQIHEVKLRQALATLPERGINLREAWISVDERMPEGWQIILACNEEGHVYLCQYKQTEFYRHTSKCDGDRLMMPYYTNITHWQPLPAPPLSHLEAKEGRG